jgi:hypothetical protein
MFVKYQTADFILNRFLPGLRYAFLPSKMKQAISMHPIYVAVTNIIVIKALNTTILQRPLNLLTDC